MEEIKPLFFHCLWYLEETLTLAASLKMGNKLKTPTEHSQDIQQRINTN